LLALLVAGAAFAAVVLLGGASHHPGAQDGGGGPSGTVVQLQGVGDYYENLSGSPDTHADTASAATDGDPSTYWYTQTYNSAQFGGLMTALGLVLDAGSPVTLTSLTVQTPTPGFTAEIRAGSSQSGPFSPVSSSQTVAGNSATFAVHGAAAQYYVVWITSLPPGGTAQISEVTAKS
jgi:hypothetical protein